MTDPFDPDPRVQVPDFYNGTWWTPDGLGTMDDAASWYEEQTYASCPYYIASNGGPKDLPGAYGPGTCGGGCWEEPACTTSFEPGRVPASRSDVHPM